jgi:hypothetical protein
VDSLLLFAAVATVLACTPASPASADDLVVDAAAAAAIEHLLNGGTDVVLKTTATGASGPGVVSSGAGDITIASRLQWSGAATLTLDAHRSVIVGARVSVTGRGGLVIATDDGGKDGDLDFTSGSVSFAHASGSLTINGTSYTLIDTLAGLQNINAGEAALGGNYALAGTLNASTAANWIPIGTDGAGNITGAGFSGTLEGLGNVISNFSVTLPSGDFVGLFGYSGGTIRDIGMTRGSVTGKSSVGELVGYNAGTIACAFVTGTANNGEEAGRVRAAREKAPYAYVGGLAGINIGTIHNSAATVAVTGHGYVGGLVGENDAGSIDGSFATGRVKGDADVGGLVGETYQGTVTNSYATGEVSGDQSGGLIGDFYDGVLGSSYASGRIIGRDAGGLVGGRLGGKIDSAYWDTQSSGRATSAGGAGRTTAELKGALPKGFSTAYWGTGPGLFPYLLWQSGH